MLVQILDTPTDDNLVQVLDTQTDDNLGNRKWNRRLSSIRSSETFQNPQPFGSYDMHVGKEEAQAQKQVNVHKISISCSITPI